MTALLSGCRSGRWPWAGCRSLNFCRGCRPTPTGGPGGWLAASAFGLFVAGVTWISRHEAGDEADDSRARGVVAGMAVQDLAILGLIAAALRVFPFPGGRRLPADRRRPEGLPVLPPTAWAINRADARAFRDPRRRGSTAVKTGARHLWLTSAGGRGPRPRCSFVCRRSGCPRTCWRSGLRYLTAESSVVAISGNPAEDRAGRPGVDGGLMQ